MNHRQRLKRKRKRKRKQNAYANTADSYLPPGLELHEPPSSSLSSSLLSKHRLAESNSFLQLPQAQPLVAPNPLVRTVNPGDRVNIPCSLANMGGSIQFAKDDQPIILDSGCAHCQLDISNEGQASLTINRVSSKDQGHWQCWRLDASGKVKQKIPIIQLVITNSPELPILIVNDKELLGSNNLDTTITVKENEIVSFKCVIKGATTPVDYVHWMLDSSQNVTHMSQFKVEYFPQESFLTQSLLNLNATKSMNLKSISCLSYHQLWLTPMTVTAVLNVLYEPSFTISREPGFGIPVSEGMTVILKCEIDSNPISSPIWIKDADNKTMGANGQAGSGQGATPGGALTSKEQIGAGEPTVLDTQEDGSVVFQPAQRSHSGWYRCKTENKYGNFSSFGYYLNVRQNSATGALTSSPQHQPLASVTPLSQQSTPRHTTPAPARIMGPNQPVQRGQHYFNGIGSGGSSNIINNDQPHGNPSTSPSNSVSPLQAQSDVAGCKGNRLDGFPEIDNPKTTVNAVLGRQLTLRLRFCCNPRPTNIFWIHRHLAMIPGRMFGPYITREIYPAYNSYYCYESTFEIESVKPEDIGTVYVFISNERGHAGAQIQIQLSADQNSLAGPRFSAPGSSAFRNTSPEDPINRLARLITLALSTPLLAVAYFYSPTGTTILQTRLSYR